MVSGKLYLRAGAAALALAATQARADDREPQGAAHQGSAMPAGPSATVPLMPDQSAAVHGAEPTASDIVVTARRRAERLQDVPISITAFSGSALKQQNITKTEDLQFKTPGLTVQPSSFGKSAVSFGMRSQRQYLVYMTLDQSVGIYQDEVYQSRTNGLNSSLFDLSSVQVLHGPQGTLFGRNTPGGAILFTSQRPTDEFGGYATLTAGNYNDRTAEGALNIPLTDTLQVRAAGRFVKHDGYTKNLAGPDLDDEDSSAYRVSISFKPTSSLRNLLILSGMRETDNGTGYKAVPLQAAYAAYYQANNLFGFGRGITAPVLATLATKGYHTVEDSQAYPGIRVRSFGLTNTTEYNIADGLMLKNIFGYRHTTSLNQFDFDGTPTAVFVSGEEQHSKQYSDELQLQGKALANSLDYILGGYYFRETGTDFQTTNGRLSGGDTRNDSKAVFGQLTWRPTFLDGLSVTAGARYTEDRRYFDAHSRNPPAAGQTVGTCRIPISDAAPTVTRDPCSLVNRATFRQPTWTGSIDYHLTRNILLYGTYRRGYRSGGFTFSGTRLAEFAPFKPETVDDFEIGIKSTTEVLEGPLKFNLAVYHDNYKDIQRTVSETRVEDGVLFPVTLTKNAAQAHINGVEIESSWQPVKQIELTGFFNYSKPEYKDFILQTSFGSINYGNNPFAFAPRKTYGAGISYTTGLPNDIGELALRLDYFHQGKEYAQDTVFDPLNQAFICQNKVSAAACPAVRDNAASSALESAPLGELPAYSIFNARLDLRGIAGSKVDLGLWVKNLTNRNYAVGAVDLTAAVGTVVQILGNPRTFGGDVTVRF